jgi:glycosyltransferase involved in cell wall biosynthesis
MNILLIVPLPPPISGHSLVSKALFDELVKYHRVEAVNFNKESYTEGLNNYRRLITVFHVLVAVWHKKKDVEAIYLTISESLAGNIKDLVIYSICHEKLDKTYIHLHGGSIKRLLWDRHKILFKLNKLFIKRFAGVIISGRSHVEIFNSMIQAGKMHIVPNFAQDHLFVSEEAIREKFASLESMRFLFMSNFIEKKGFNELVDAYLSLSGALKKIIRIDFAGRFDSDDKKELFLRKIRGLDRIRYHGIVDDDAKKALFAQAHVFCLPTSFFEGQPISILEAYASGCVVMTTGQQGIRDIFTPGLNGFEVQEKSADSIRSAMEEIHEKREKLLQIAVTNCILAGEKYRMSTYTSSIRKILEAPVSRASQRN